MVAAAVGVVSGVAHGAGGAPAPSSAAVSQYAELVPTGSGPTAPGVGDAALVELGPKARLALAQTSDATAKALATIATSSDYGAPATITDSAGVASGADPALESDGSVDRTLQAAASAASPVGDAYMVGLLVALFVVTAGGAGLALQARGG